VKAVIPFHRANGRGIYMDAYMDVYIDGYIDGYMAHGWRLKIGEVSG
jgi:hypothetical protein